MSDVIPSAFRVQLLESYRARRIGDFLAVVREVIDFLKETGLTLDQVLTFLRTIFALFGSAEPAAQAVTVDAKWVDDNLSKPGEGELAAQAIGDGRIIEIITLLLTLFERFFPRS